MPIFQSNPPEKSPLRIPAEKRISLPASQRLTTITEGQNGDIRQPPPIPRRSSRRNSLSSRHSRRWSLGSSIEGTIKPAPPPPYDWVSEPLDSRGDDTSKREKVLWLHRGERKDEKGRRGGWLRLGLIIGLVLLVIVGLAIGLGIGLTRRKDHSSTTGRPSTTTSTITPSPPNSKPSQGFPLGEYSLVTALQSLTAGCTATPATWRCWPYVVYSPSTNASSLANFNWIIRNTSSSYATSVTATTSEEGVPANLTVSTSDDPFGLTFSDKALTYISSSTDGSSARYTFSYTMSKQVDPLIALTQDNAATTCFYNQTTFTGTLYLSQPRNYPPGNLAESTSLGGFQQWPYAVEVTQTAIGGTDVPNCYKTVDGILGDSITYGLEPQPSTSQCSCDYRNF